MITKKIRNRRIALTAIITLLSEGLVALYVIFFTDDNASNETITKVWMFAGGILIACAFVVFNIWTTTIKEPPIERKPRG